MTALDTIIFDLGGVLIDWNPRYLYRKLIDQEDDIEYFLEFVCTSDWNEQQDAGHPLDQATREKIEEHPEYADLIRAFYGRWPEMLAGPIHGTVDILNELHTQNSHQLLALTNWSAETFPIAWERYEFLRNFADILVSGQVKLKKPDPAIYQMLIDRHGLTPNTTLFIDDNARNVHAAQALGLKTILFTSPDALRQEFRESFGLLEY